MESKKELGMGWYVFLRYFPFGIMRIISFIWLIFNLLPFVANINILSTILIISCMLDFILRVMIHSHLENYSSSMSKIMLFFYTNNVIMYSLHSITDYNFYVSIVFSILLYGSIYLINCKYFEKSSHIFVNECDFGGNIVSRKKAKKANVLDDVHAAKDVQKLKDGKETELSVSQITTLIINLMEAKAYLNDEEFSEVEALYNSFRKDTEKIKMNQNKYMETCFSIINSFDEIAPYEKYSGGNSYEFTLFMREIRNKNIDEIRKTRKQIKEIEFFLKNMKPYFDDIKSGKEKILSDEELNALLASKRMTQKEVDDYRISRENVKSYFMAESLLGENFQEETLVELKEQLNSLRKEGCRQPSFEETNSEPLVEEKTLHNNFCRKCGAKLQEDSKFCHKCGTEVINF